MSFDKYCRRLIWAVRADLLARTSFGKVDTLPSTSGRVAGQGWLPSICTSTSETGSSLNGVIRVIGSAASTSTFATDRARCQGRRDSPPVGPPRPTPDLTFVPILDRPLETSKNRHIR